jgi:uncharacterized pyridoxamine 5'-phosphate oxidase family protein
VQSNLEVSIQRCENIIAADAWNPKPTLFKKLFKAEEGGMSHIEIVNKAEVYIITGSDTTAHTLVCSVWAACQNPDVKRMLMEEVPTLSDRYRYADEDAKKLPYLSHVLICTSCNSSRWETLTKEVKEVWMSFRGGACGMSSTSTKQSISLTKLTSCRG